MKENACHDDSILLWKAVISTSQELDDIKIRLKIARSAITKHDNRGQEDRSLYSLPCMWTRNVTDCGNRVGRFCECVERSWAVASFFIIAVRVLCKSESLNSLDYADKTFHSESLPVFPDFSIAETNAHWRTGAHGVVPSTLSQFVCQVNCSSHLELWAQVSSENR